jgi:hypothetical protein
MQADVSRMLTRGNSRVGVGEGMRVRVGVSTGVGVKVGMGVGVSVIGTSTTRVTSTVARRVSTRVTSTLRISGVGVMLAVAQATALKMSKQPIKPLSIHPKILEKSEF